MSFYNVPVVDEFDADKALAVRAKEAGMAAEKIIETWKTAYEKFWMTPRTHGERALTPAQMQAVINKDPALVTDILTDSAAFLQFVQTAHPSRIDEYIPVRYRSSPYEMDGLTIGALKPEWEVQDETE